MPPTWSEQGCGSAEIRTKVRAEREDIVIRKGGGIAAYVGQMARRAKEHSTIRPNNT